MIDTQASEEYFKILSIWLWDYVLTIKLVIQLSVVALGLLIALYASHRIRQHFPLPQENLRPQRTAMRLIRRLAFPIALIIWLNLGITAYNLHDEPHLILSKISSLTMAWALIRLVSSFIENSTISHIVATLIWSIAALHILDYLPLVIAWLESVKLGQGDNALTLYALVSSTLSVAAFIWLALIGAKTLERSIHNNPHFSLATQVLLSKVSKFVLLSLAFLVGLNLVGVDLTAFAVLGGAIGVGIGLGLQKVFSNLIAGIILLLDNSIKPGDTIVFQGRYGRVNRLSGRYVAMITRDGTEHLIPNDELINNQVENWSHSSPNVRLKIPVGIHYKADVHQAMQLCIEAAQETTRVLKHPQPVCLLKEFSDSAIQLEQRIWIKDPMNGCSNVKSEVLLKIWDKFQEHNIEIPYPQRDLHVRSISPELPLPPA